MRLKYFDEPFEQANSVASLVDDHNYIIAFGYLVCTDLSTYFIISA